MDKVFKALGDKTRLEILLLINLHPSICLCHLECCFELSNSNLSRHLKELEQVNLITYKKITKWKHYQLSSLGINIVDLITKNTDTRLLELIKVKSKQITEGLAQC